MQNFYYLSGYETKTTIVNGFVAMKSDWERLNATQQIACVAKLLLGLSLSQENRDRLARFVRTINMPDFMLGNLKITRINHGNAIEFLLTETVEKQPVMQGCSEEDYKRFLEDAKDEEEK